MAKTSKPSTTAFKINGEWYYTTKLWKNNEDGTVTVTCVDGKIVTGKFTAIIANYKG